MPVTIIVLIAYSAWAPHYKTCPPCYAACGSRFKPLALQAKVPSSTLGCGTICSAGQAVKPSASQAEVPSSILGQSTTGPTACEVEPLTRILADVSLNYHSHQMVICGMKERKTVYQKKRSKTHSTAPIFGSINNGFKTAIIVSHFHDAGYKTASKVILL